MPASSRNGTEASVAGAQTWDMGRRQIIKVSQTLQGLCILLSTKQGAISAGRDLRNGTISHKFENDTSGDC